VGQPAIAGTAKKMYSGGNLNTSAPDYSAGMSEYYRSIEGPFHDTLSSQEKDRHNILDESVDYLVGALILSLFPVLPLILYWLVPRLTGRGQFRFQNLTIPLHSFRLWWALCVVLLIALLWSTSAVTKRISRARKKHWLPPAQVRFALCYAIVRQLRDHELNKVPRFFDDAVKYWDELLPYLRKFFNPIPGALVEQVYMIGPDLDEAVMKELGVRGFPTSPGYHRTLSFFPQISALLMEPWFSLAPETKAIVEGLNGVFSKLAPRLQKKAELGKVADCLELLSGFFYSGLSSIAGNPINDWGVAQLASFAAGVNALSSY
jgi:hypothetical protein